MSGSYEKDAPLLEVRGLKKYFPVRSRSFFSGERRVVKAVDGVDLSVTRGETVGLVGESGCGKSTLGRTIVRLYEPTEGEIVFAGDTVPDRRRVQMIFQDPYASLNPRMTVGDIISEPLAIHGIGTRTERAERVHALLRQVGLNPDHAMRYPHEFSGGQRQRIGIARALSAEPEFVVCDEPISALDVSIQAQVVNVLEDLRDLYGLTYLFIAHDLSMIRHISDRVGVMYLGRIVEIAPAEELYGNPEHPYTKALLSSIPRIGSRKEGAGERRIVLKGDVPSPIDPPSGCTFRTRCPHAAEECADQVPVLTEREAGHYVACRLY
ncbi:MAG: ATP-binding cassette domain-containing protein [Synergistaceae bacterium]|jgi:oligopeptide transport system ATP-binding protein|nr:ATP-binding cassette domain-containing protein [Synergistaceae bacterium]